MTAVYIVTGLLLLLVAYDLVQRKHAILRNFPILGHFRYLFEMVGPELRQYIVTGNNEERPFSRDERSWVYASAKQQNNYIGFGTDDDLELSPNFLVFEQSAFPIDTPASGQPHHDAEYRLPAAKVLGGPRRRPRAFRPESVVNISAMSFGSLGGRAIEALNRGAALAGCLHNTGEGGVSPHHDHGGGLIWQIGAGYFGCRDRHGRFSLPALVDRVGRSDIKAIEIKLSQGAKPGLGGILPAAKVTAEIARIRGVTPGETVISPSAHSEFHDVDAMLDFAERIAEATGLPVGIKSAVGQMDFWYELADTMATEDRGVDFIAIDGGEGGTGAAPLVFSDHVALPFKLGFSKVYRVFAGRGITDRVTFIGSGKLGFPENALLAFALGADLIAVGREAMLAIGCIQAQRCHTGHCPTGVATHNRWLTRGLVPGDKAPRFANYVRTLRKDLIRLSHAIGVEHPALVTTEHCTILDDRFGGTSAREVFHYVEDWGRPSAADATAIVEIMRELRGAGARDVC